MRPPEFLLFQADALRIPLADKSVHACVTSPPYYNLRSYETAKWIGGDPACDHQAPIEGGKSGNKGQYQRHAGRFAGPACYRCGAQRIDRQIGLEKSPSDYVAALVAAFAEVHRVLRDDGMLWVNISGSYAGGGGGNYGNGKSVRSQGGQQITNVRNRPKWLTNAGMKPKDLIYIPAMLALELQKWGWYLRSDCIWSKVNCLPEPVLDRPSKSHEYLFLFSKKARYFYDPDAVAEPVADATADRYLYAFGGEKNETLVEANKDGMGVRTRVVGTREPPTTRNMRSVITLPTESFPGSHYAVMPSALASICIRAGTSQAGCCPQCGAPYRRVVERKSQQSAPSWRGTDRGNDCPTGGGHIGRTGIWTSESKTLGWTPGCKCNAGNPIPCRVFDPFGGVATSALVAVGLGRDGIACDLSAKYLKMGKRRIERPHAPVQRAPNPNRPEKPTPLFKDGDE